jgi:hypothetical protein
VNSKKIPPEYKVFAAVEEDAVDKSDKYERTQHYLGSEDNSKIY